MRCNVIIAYLLGCFKLPKSSLYGQWLYKRRFFLSILDFLFGVSIFELSIIYEM